MIPIFSFGPHILMYDLLALDYMLFGFSQIACCDKHEFCVFFKYIVCYIYIYREYVRCLTTKKSMINLRIWCLHHIFLNPIEIILHNKLIYNYCPFQYKCHQRILKILIHIIINFMNVKNQ